MGSDIFVVGGANSQARFACFAWRVDSFSLWKSNPQTSFGDVYRLDLLRKRWTLLQHPRWPGLIVRWPRKTLKPFTTLGCWLLLVSVLVTNSTRGFCAMCSCQFFGRWWLENVKPNQSRSCGRHRRIGKIKVWFLIGGLISTSWTFQVTSGYIVGRFF